VGPRSNRGAPARTGNMPKKGPGMLNDAKSRARPKSPALHRDILLHTSRPDQNTGGLQAPASPTQRPLTSSTRAPSLSKLQNRAEHGKYEYSHSRLQNNTPDPQTLHPPTPAAPCPAGPPIRRASRARLAARQRRFALRPRARAGAGPTRARARPGGRRAAARAAGLPRWASWRPPRRPAPATPCPAPRAPPAGRCCRRRRRRRARARRPATSPIPALTAPRPPATGRPDAPPRRSHPPGRRRPPRQRARRRPRAWRSARPAAGWRRRRARPARATRSRPPPRPASSQTGRPRRTGCEPARMRAAVKTVLDVTTWLRRRAGGSGRRSVAAAGDAQAALVLQAQPASTRVQRASWLVDTNDPGTPAGRGALVLRNAHQAAAQLARARRAALRARGAVHARSPWRARRAAMGLVRVRAAHHALRPLLVQAVDHVERPDNQRGLQEALWRGQPLWALLDEASSAKPRSRRDAPALARPAAHVWGAARLAPQPTHWCTLAGLTFSAYCNNHLPCHSAVSCALPRHAAAL